MRHRHFLTMLALSSCLLSGCGAARIDATSEASMKASMDRMTAGMTEAQKKDFAADCMSLVMGDMLQMAMQNMANPKAVATPPDPLKMFAPLNGMTRDEIHAKAVEKRAALAK